MKVSAHNLKDLALDWAVAKVLGYKVRFVVDSHFPFEITMHDAHDSSHMISGLWRPSFILSQGDTIIEKYGIATEKGGNGWQAVEKTFSDNKDERYNGKFRLIAAMRCFVGTCANGKEIDIPYNLINKEYQS